MKDMGTFVGQLVFRSFDRAGRVYAAMRCRGFDGVYRSAGDATLLRFAEAACAALVSALIIAARFCNVSRSIGVWAGNL
jgi:cobalt/nickel transport system permease protein